MPMAMKLPVAERQEPIRAPLRTAGSFSGLALRILPMAPAAIVAGERSETTLLRSRITPFLSRMPGFSRPFGPKRNSFMSKSP